MKFKTVITNTAIIAGVFLLGKFCGKVDCLKCIASKYKDAISVDELVLKLGKNVKIITKVREKES